MKYTVKNVYGIRGESHHMTTGAALRERDRREGDGWVVEDNNGIRVDWDAEGTITEGGYRV